MANLVWLTVPVLTKGRTGQRSDEAGIAEAGWATKHVRTIEQALGRAPHFDLLASTVLETLRGLGDADLLHDINRSTLVELARVLGLDTTFSLDGDHGPVDGDPSERVAELVRRAGGTHYLTGPAGLAYLRSEPFAEREVTIEVIDYSTLQPYPQLHGEFENAVSVIDLIANCGPDAGSHLTSTVRSVVEVRPESSVTVRLTVWVPAVRYVWVAVGPLACDRSGSRIDRGTLGIAA